MDGQIATAKTKAGTESFLWDGLALISRNETEYVNEPYVTGGNPILANDKVLFNDMLGNTVSTISSNELNPIFMTAFGETADKNAMFTGKPYIGELGYAFLFRNYRPDQGKWQTQDPLGYPDGWNNFAYVNNGVTLKIDWQGGKGYWVYDTHEVDYYITTFYSFDTPPNNFITLYISNPGISAVPGSMTRAEYIKAYVESHCRSAKPPVYTPPSDVYNVNVQVTYDKDTYNFTDTGTHNDTWAIVKVFDVTTQWHIHGTYQTRRWVVEE